MTTTHDVFVLSLIVLGMMLVFPAIVFSRTLVVANFDNGASPLSIDPTADHSSTDVTAVTGTYVAHSVSEPAHGNTGYSFKIRHLNTNDAFFLLTFASVDLRGMRTLSFWIRADTAGINFKLDLRRASAPNEPGYRPSIREFVTEDISSEWKKVNIPLKAIFKDFLGGGYNPLQDVNAIVFNFTGTLPAGNVYIDDVVFHDDSGNIMIDNFDDGGNPWVMGNNPFNYLVGFSGTPPAFAGSYDAANAFGGTGNAFKIVWTTGGVLLSSSAAMIGNELSTRSFTNTGTGIDISGDDTLSLQIKGGTGADGKLIGLGLADDAGTEKIHPSSVTITTSYQQITRPLGDYAVNKDSFSVFEIWTINDSAGRGPGINSASGMTFYIDNVRFLDTSSPTVPSSLLKSGAVVANGAMFTSTDVLTVTGPSGSTDQSIERVRFEHDNLTGGASWYVIGADTDTSKTSYAAVWNNFSSLKAGNTYQIRAVAEDIAGNEGRMTPFTGIMIPLVNAASGFTATVLSSTSIQWNWIDNSSNETGFGVFSSSGQMSPTLAANTTFWIETALSPNTQYTRYVRPIFNNVAYSTSAAATKFTFSNPVISISFVSRIDPFAVIAWSTGTGGNGQFDVQRAVDVFGGPGTFESRSIVVGSTFSFLDNGLTSGVTYWYRVIGYNGDLVAVAASPLLRVPSTIGPVIAHTPPSAIIVPAGSSANDLSLSAVVTSDQMLSSVTLNYRKIGQSTFTLASFSPAVNISSTVYSGSATISASFIKDSVASGGFEYRIVAMDTLYTSSSPLSGVYSIPVSDIVTAPPVGAQGGTITVDDGDATHAKTSLTIPAGALSQTVSVTVKQLNPASAPAQNGQSPVSAFEFGPTGLMFNRPVTMTISYADKDQNGIVDGTNIDENTLKFFWYDGFAWRNLGGTVNPADNTVTATVSHFSTFGLFQAADLTEADVRPKEKIITPNGDGVNDFAQFGITGTFDIKILDVRGKMIRHLENNNLWDGRRENGELAESGVYIYQLKSDRFKLSGTIGVAR